MSIAGALIGAGGSLLGGIFGRKKPKVDPRQIAKQIEGQALGARQAGEKYGFNPLALLGLPVDVGAASSNPAAFGRAIADAALTIGENVGNTSRDAENSKLRQANAQLQERVQRLTLRKPVPGVYERNGGAASVSRGGAVSGGRDAGLSGASGEAGPLRALPQKDDLPLSDPRRAVQNAPIVSDALVSRVDNPNADPFSILTYNGELVGPGEAMMIGGAWALDKFRRDVDRERRTRRHVSGSPADRVRPDMALRVPPSGKRVAGYTVKEWRGRNNKGPRGQAPIPYQAPFGFTPGAFP